MAIAKPRQLLTLGDRAPNLFLADQRDVVISLNDKVRGGPVLVLLYPTQKDPGCAAELQKLFALAPEMAAFGTHIFAIGGDPVGAVQKLAAQHEPDFFMLADPDHRGAEAFGARGKLVGFVLGPDQRVRDVLPAGKEPIAERALPLLRDLKPHPPFAAPFHPPILIIPDALPAEFCAYLVEQFEKRGNEPSGTLRMVAGKMVHADDGAVKRRRDHHVVDADLMEQIASYMERRVLTEIRRAFHCPINYVEEFKIVRYDAEPGGYFRTHRDNTTPGTAHRRFAMTLNLNSDEYEGGELRFPEYDNATYKPHTGEAVIFSCDLLHEATDVTKGQRYTLLSFMYDETGRQQLEKYQRMMQQRQAQQA